MDKQEALKRIEELKKFVEDCDKQENVFPESVAEIKYINHMSKYSRAEAILAYIQLLELCDEVNRRMGHTPKWDGGTINNVIFARNDKSFDISVCYTVHKPFAFKDSETCNEFIEKYKDLFDKAWEVM